MTRPVIILLLVSLFIRLGLAFSVYSGDLNNHTGWADSILSRGFRGAYDREYTGVMQPTYPPLSLYAFVTSTGFYRLIYQAAVSANRSISLFPSQTIWWLEDQDVLPAFNKVITIASDLGVGLLVYMFIRRQKFGSESRALFASAAYLINPAVWYTSALWGQIESFPLFWLLLSFWYLSGRRTWAAPAAFIAALLSKQSVIIFTPVFLLASWRILGFRATLRGLILQLSLFFAAYLPFWSKPDLVWPVSVYLHRIQVGSGSNWITDHAFNLWVWYSHLQKIPDSVPITGSLTPWHVGTAAFLVVAGVCVWMLYCRRLTWPRIFLISALIPALAFLILTKMHERYFAPVLPFLTLSAARYPGLWVVYAAASLAHLANLYHDWWFPRIPFLVNWLTNSGTISLMVVTFALSTGTLLYYYVKK